MFQPLTIVIESGWEMWFEVKMYFYIFGMNIQRGLSVLIWKEKGKQESVRLQLLLNWMRGISFVTLTVSET